MSDELGFFIEEGGRSIGPTTDDDLRDRLREGTLDPDAVVRLASAQVRAPARAWATLAVRRSSAHPLPKPSNPRESGTGGASPDLLSAPRDVLDMLLYVLFEEERSSGPFTGEQIRAAVEGGKHRAALVAIVGTEDWIAARRLFDRTLTDGSAALAVVSAKASAALTTVRCPTCLEVVVATGTQCPECDEPLEPASAARSSRAGSIPDEPEGAGWLRLHWRPLVTFGAILGLILAGITLRFLAPGRLKAAEQRAASSQTAPPPSVACEHACWSGEACQAGQCTWQRPKGVGHLKTKPSVSGPWELPKDVSDALLLDDERFAVGLYAGVQIRSTKTGQALELVSEALQTRRLYRVGDTFYAVGPQQLSVVDVADARLLKTIDMGAIVGDLTLGANGRRALVSLPGAHAIAIFSTELHSEIDRIRFGDDAVGPVGADDTGKRALTTTGMTPLAGLADPPGGAVYAFDPGRLATAQDRVRASMLGNPVAVLMAPDGESSFVVLRAKNAIVPLEWLPSGAVRQKTPIETCDQPEQIELVRKTRQAVVRCRRGRAIEVFDLATGKLVRHVPLSAPATDMAVSPDGEQVVVALPGDADGSIGLVDTTTFEVELVPTAAPPSRVRVAPDGSSVLALSDRTKVAWVLR